MDVLSIINAVADTGFMVVAAGIVLWLYLKNDKDRSKREQDHEKQELDRQAQQDKKYDDLFKLVVGKIEGLAPCSPVHTADEDEHQEKINQEINLVLKNLRDSTQASRAMLIRYHNGMYDLVGNSAIKMSITNEADAIGVQPLLPQFQNQFRGFLAYFCAEIRDQGYCYIGNIETLKEKREYTLYEFLAGRGIVSTFGRAVYNNDKKVVGFVVVEYFNTNYPTMGEIDGCLRDKSNKISALMSIASPIDRSQN